MSIVVGMALAPSPASAWCRMTTSRRVPASITECVMEGQPLYWTRWCMAYAFHVDGARDLTMPQVEEIFATSFRTWTDVACGGASTGLSVLAFEQRTTVNIARYNTRSPNVNAIVFVDDWAERDHEARAFALTTVWHNPMTGEIFDADMEINQDRGRYGICPPTGCTDGTIDLQNVVTHEAGHFLAIAHSEDRNASMYGESPPGEIAKRTVQMDDREVFCEIYDARAPRACMPDDYTPRNGLGLDGGTDDEGCCTVAAGRGRLPARDALAIGLGAVLFVARRRRARVTRARDASSNARQP